MFISWLGKNDIQGAYVNPQKGYGSIHEALKSFGSLFDKVFILNSYSINDINKMIADCGKSFHNDSEFEKDYSTILSKIYSGPLTIINIQLQSPIDHAEIFERATEFIKNLKKEFSVKSQVYFNLTSGTPAMSAVFLLLGKSFLPGKFIQTTEFEGITARIVDLPFDIWTDYIPEIIEHRNIFKADIQIAKSFDNIITNTKTVKKLIKIGSFIAKDNCSVLITGETGTGKELFAHAIHNSSFRLDQKFIAVNCAAIPSELLESELFGYEKGSFTGAQKEKPGLFEAADHGTIFLDEIGDMPISLQVKLLRVLQEGKIRRIGGINDIRVDVRVITATNKDLFKEINNGAFREDLYYRIAQFEISLPPLRERPKDIQLLADVFLGELNTFALNNGIEGLESKRFTPKGRKLLSVQNWNGNIRELKLVINRAFLQANMFGTEIDDKIIEGSIIMRDKRNNNSVHIELPIVFDERIAELERYLVNKAWQESGESVTKAAELLGFSNYQRFQLLQKKYGIKKS